MMPLGPSPESGFAGVWRFVIEGEAGAVGQAAHVEQGRGAAARILGVDFAEGAVKGPSPLARGECATFLGRDLSRRSVRRPARRRQERGDGEAGAPRR